MSNCFSNICLPTPCSLFSVKANLISLADPHKFVLSSHSKSLKAWKPLAPSDYFASATLGLESPPICFHLTSHLLKFWDLPDKIIYPPCNFSECFFYPYFIPFQPSSPSPWRLHTVGGQSASLDFWIRHPWVLTLVPPQWASLSLEWTLKITAQQYAPEDEKCELMTQSLEYSIIVVYFILSITLPRNLSPRNL